MSESLSDSITVKVDDEDRVIKMSYGLLTLCTRVIKSDIELSGADPEVRDLLLEIALTKREPTGKSIEEFKLPEHALSVGDMTKLFAWVQGHLIDFLSQTAKGLGEAARRVEALTAPSSQRSSTGTKP